jgi:hypothetical protein
MTDKKILNCSRALVVLVAITMGFVISLRRDAPEEPAQGQPVEDLTAINAKLDRILEEGRSRDTVLLQHLQHLLRMQQQQQGRGASQGRIAEAFE